MYYVYLFVIEILQLVKGVDSPGPNLLLGKGQDVTVHFLSSAQTQKPNLKLLQFQQNIVYCRMRVAGQEHTEATGVQNTHLKNKQMFK